MEYLGALRALLCSLCFICFSAYAQGESSMEVPFSEMKGPSLGIIHGDVASKGEFPYQAAIYLDFSSFCGGALISERWVLTAGHCVDGFSTWTVYLGALNIMKPKEQDRRAFVTRGGVLHPEFSFPYKDIALILLARDATLTNDIQVIVLPPSTTSTYVGRKATISGWGKTRDAAVTISSHLRYTSLNVVDLSVCREAYNNPKYEDSMICTQGVGDRATCKGDSGGPLVITDEYNETVLIGLTSMGNKVGCEAAYPNGFANVAYFLPWITKVTNIPFV